MDSKQYSKSIEKSCACKGVRTCTICENQEANFKEYQHDEILQYVYCQKCFMCHLLKTNNDFEDVSNYCNDSLQEKIKVDGIFLFQNFITDQEEKFLLKEINKNKWIDSQSGRFKQDYGPKVNFKKKKLKLERFTGLPFYSQVITERLNKIDVSIVKDAEFHPVELCNLKYENERGLKF
jgi:alkylated DNA repair protein alkB family protein 4